MDLIMLTLFAFFPLAVGFLVINIITEPRLSRSIFLFLLFGSIWQFDVAILYAHTILPRESLDFFFRLLRLGPIMLTPTLFYIAYAITKEMMEDNLKSRWRLVASKPFVIFIYFWSTIVYLVGWSDKGIKKIILIESEKYASFSFPIYGSYSWIFHTNTALFIVGIIVCLRLTLKLKNNEYKSFLLFFITTISIGYSIGMLNMFPETRLYPSGIAVLFFAILVLTLSMRLHAKIVKRMNKTLDSQKNLLQTLIDLNPNYIYAKNQDGVFTLVNKAFANLHGLSPEKIIGKAELNASNDDVIIRHFFSEDHIKNEIVEAIATEEEIKDIHGNQKWLKTFKVPIFTVENKLLLGVSSDITELKKQEEKIRYLAYHDELTELPNRRLFNEDLCHVIENAKKNDEQIGLLFLDLDRFKYINDTLGHNMGDLLLFEIAARLKTTVKKWEHSVKVYRLGGDEFTIIFPNCEHTSVTKLATTILDMFTDPLPVECHHLYMTPSIGISMYPLDGQDAITLMKNADAALYFVKEREKNSFQFYYPEINEHFHRKMLLEKHLRTALDKKEFELHYQPQLHIQSGIISGMEALVRWNNEELGSVSPGEFIPLAEETSLILPIGEWIMREACWQNKKWQEQGYPPLKVAVNISLKQFNDRHFIEMVSKILEETKLKPELLELEITESIAINDPAVTIHKLQLLKALGVKVSIDDFGSGYSSLSYLQKYPIDILKIDKSFITQIPCNKENTAIVNSILSLAQSLHVDVIAEGVENEAEFTYLQNTSCKYAQGYYISRPFTAADFQREVLSGRLSGMN